MRTRLAVIIVLICSAFREEDLVRAGECALEPHRRGIILAPGQGKLCPVDAPRPKGACFLGEDRDTSMEQGPERRVTLVGGWISCAVGLNALRL